MKLAVTKYDNKARSFFRMFVKKIGISSKKDICISEKYHADGTAVLSSYQTLC